MKRILRQDARALLRRHGADVAAAGRRGRVARVIAAAVTGRDGAVQSVKTAARVHTTFIRGGLLGLGYPWAASCLGRDPSGWPAPWSSQAPDSVVVVFTPRAFLKPTRCSWSAGMPVHLDLSGLP